MCAPCGYKYNNASAKINCTEHSVGRSVGRTPGQKKQKNKNNTHWNNKTTRETDGLIDLQEFETPAAAVASDAIQQSNS